MLNNIYNYVFVFFLKNLFVMYYSYYALLYFYCITFIRVINFFTFFMAKVRLDEIASSDMATFA